MVQEDRSATLATNNDQYLFQPVVRCYDIGEARLRTPSEYKDVSPTLSARCGTGGNNTPAVVTFDARGNGDGKTVNTITGGHESSISDFTSVVIESQPVIALDRASFNQGKNAQFDFEVNDNGVNSPLVARGPGAVCYGLDQQGGKGGANYTEDVAPTILSDSHGTPHAVCYSNTVAKTRYIVRRLTPLECERLQGYPDGWTDIGDWVDTNGKKRQTSDAARYKALGNSIALPPWKWVLKRICACYERDATMASLFDGIGGFPYLWEQLNGKGSCLWASEIEEFPIAVTKVRIGE